MFLDALRQWRFPRAWRIPAAEPGEEMRAEVAKLLAAFERGAVPPPSGDDPAPAGLTVDDKFIAEMATGLWRMRTRMLDPETNRALDSMKRPFRHLESVWELLNTAGIEVQDHTNETFNSGLALSVIAFQPTEGLDRERVLETIRPSIYRGDRVVQMGQVIVGTPLAAAAGQAR
jgi:hypothetical protein